MEMQESTILQALTKLTTTFAPLKGKAYYEAICEYIVEHFEIDYTYVARLDEEQKSVKVLGGWCYERPMVSFEYELRDTPSETLIAKDYLLYPKDITKHFPKDSLLLKLEVESYGGIILYNKDQEPIGIFVLLSKKPFNNTQLISHLLKLYIATLASEIQRDESENNQSNLEHIAYYDPLTKLPNRLLITDRIRQAIKNQAREKSIVAIALMDLDGFKSVNDSLGHDAGDQVLIEASRRIEAIIRPEDTIARLGGDEFVIVLTDVLTSKDVGKVLLRILRKISQPYYYKKRVIESISASIGVTLYPEDNVDDDTLLRHADQAMYKAKENGRNQFYFFDTKEHKKVKANFKALKKIEKAMNNGEFELYFQPKLSRHTLKIESVEVLTRWNHPILGILSPSEFLPLIENDDLVYIFDQWVIRQSLLIIIKLHEQGIKLSLSINISPKQFKQKEFVTNVKKIANEIGMDYRYFKFIEFEIVESSALESIHHTNETIQELKSIGVGFALDDFGTGYSSLTHLRELHINTIKIDQSFIFEMLHNTQDMAIVNAIISLSKVFQIEVVAEGVENIEQLLMLFELGCDSIQGYRVARPMSYDHLLIYITEFAPDPRWQISLSYLPRRADFELLLAQSNHKYWVELVIDSLKNKKLENLPILSHEGCRLGKWLNHRGREYFSILPSFYELIGTHKKIHQEVNMIIDTFKKNNDTLSQEHVDSITNRRDELMLLIERLKEEYRTTLVVKGAKGVK